MKLQTSSFQTIFRKDLFRFAPLWALYFIGGLMVTLGMFSGGIAEWSMVETLNSYLAVMGAINMIYAALCAQALFGDLFNSRLCNALHAMPLRRETWFLSHVTAGLCYSLVPHLVVMLLVALGMGGFFFVPLLWVAVSAMEFLFFFGVAVLSCMVTGNRIAMVLVYAIINFISLLAYGFIQLVYMPQLYGLELSGEIFSKLCPVVTLSGQPKFFGFDGYADFWDMSFSQLIRVFQINWSAWAYPAILAGLGLVALGLALLLYRRRALESAGDFVAIRILDPVFTVIYTLSAGAVFALLGQAMMEAYVPWLLVGFAVGYFTSRMFLGRTVRVFKARNFLYCGIFMAAMGISIGIVALDPLGLTRWTPEPASVSSVTLQGVSTLTLTEQAEIEKVVALQKQAVAARGKGSDLTGISIRYQLKDGSVRKRYYKMTTEMLELLRPEYSAPEHVLGYENWDLFVNSVVRIETRSYAGGDDKTFTNRNDIRELLEAIRQDCEAGIMAQEWFFERKRMELGYPELYHIEIHGGPGGYQYLSVYQNGAAAAWLETHNPTQS